MKNILIYGTGNFAKRCFHVLDRMGSIVGFIDSNPNLEGQSLFSLPIFHYSNISKIQFNLIVICSIYVDEISKILSDLNIDSSIVFDYDSYYNVFKKCGQDLRINPSPCNYFLGEQYVCQSKCITENFWTENRIISELDNGSRPVWEWLIANYIPSDGNVKILDIGCGPSQKVATYFGGSSRFEITGLDSTEAIQLAQKNNPSGNYYVCDLDSDDSIKEVSNQLGTFDIIVCLDVIEHILYPENILNLIKKHSNIKTQIFITTLERDLSKGSGKCEGSRKPEHIREWNEEEFRHFIESNGFVIKTNYKTPLVGEQVCQTVVCNSNT